MTQRARGFEIRDSPRTSPSDTVSWAAAGALNFFAFNVFIPNKLSSELVTWRASFDRVKRCATLADGAKACADAARERAMATAENFILINAIEPEPWGWKERKVDGRHFPCHGCCLECLDCPSCPLAAPPPPPLTTCSSCDV